MFIQQCQGRNLNQDQVLEMLTIRWLKELKKRPVNTDARYKGVRNKLTGFEMIKEFVNGKYAKRLNTYLETCDDIEFAKNYFKLIEFIIAKKQRVSVFDHNPEDRTINIIHSYPNSE